MWCLLDVVDDQLVFLVGQVFGVFVFIELGYGIYQILFVIFGVDWCVDCLLELDLVIQYIGLDDVDRVYFVVEDFVIEDVVDDVVFVFECFLFDLEVFDNFGKLWVIVKVVGQGDIVYIVQVGLDYVDDLWVDVYVCEYKVDYILV